KVNIVSSENIYLIPIGLFTNCTSNGNYDYLNSPLSVSLNWICNLNKESEDCPEDIINLAWTTLNDCQEGNEFHYCLNNEICGNKNCNGPCSNINDNCQLFDNYQCQANYQINKSIWQSPIFIILFIITIIMIIIIFLLSVYLVIYL